MIFGPKETPVQQLRTILVTTGWCARQSILSFQLSSHLSRVRNRFSWWAQAILSTISGVLLLFANSVTASISTFALVGRALALGGLGCAIASTLWTWGYARLAAKIGRSPETTPADASSQARNIAGFGTTLNMVGMLLCLLGAEAIVGTLAAKALTTSQSAAIGVAASPVQALDMLIVQANTNILFSHFLGLLGCQRVNKAAKACEAKA